MDMSDAEVNREVIGLVPGRDDKGRFAEGNKLMRNGGRKPKSHEMRLFEAFRKSFQPGDIEKITSTLIARAKAGDATCVKLCFSYLFGQPQQSLTVDIEGTALVELVQGLRQRE